MITDTNENPINSLDLPVRTGQAREFIIRLDCLTGRKLKSAVNADFNVEARHANTGGAFTSLFEGLELSPWSGTRQNFEIKFTAVGLVGSEHEIAIFTSQ